MKRSSDWKAGLYPKPFIYECHGQCEIEKKNSLFELSQHQLTRRMERIWTRNFWRKWAYEEAVGALKALAGTCWLF